MLFCSFMLFNVMQFFTCCNKYNKDYQDTSGVYVYKYYAKKIGSNQLVKLLPDDSIFIYRHFSIEKLTKIQNFSSNDNYVSVERENGYYFIDFKNDRFFKLNTLYDNRVENPKWDNMEKKQLGLQLHFQYYNGEKYGIKDTLIQNKKHKLVRYTSNQKNQQKDAVITVILQPNAKGVSLIPNLETTFKGRVKEISVLYPNNQGEVQITIDFIKKPVSDRMITYVKDIVSKLNLK